MSKQLRRTLFISLPIVLIIALLVGLLVSFRVTVGPSKNLVSINISQNVVLANPGWVDPTGNVANGWADPTYAYNNDTGTSASYEVAKKSWSPYLELTYATGLECDKVQVYITGQTTDIDQVEVDVYYSGAYNNIYSGVLTQSSYVEYAIGSTQTVTAMQVRVYNSKANASRFAYIHDADFDEVVAEPDISVAPVSYDFGVVAESTTPYTATNYFTTTNSSSMQTDQTIGVTASTWSGGVTWTHSDTATPGANQAGLLANKEGTWGVGDVIVKYNSPNYIAENQPASTDYSFGLKLVAPTSFGDGVEKAITVRVNASAG